MALKGALWPRALRTRAQGFLPPSELRFRWCLLGDLEGPSGGTPQSPHETAPHAYAPSSDRP